MMELSAVIYFHKNVSSYIFDRILWPPDSVLIDSFSQEFCPFRLKEDGDLNCTYGDIYLL